MLDNLMAFRDYLDIAGWFHAEGRTLSRVRVEGMPSLATAVKTQVKHDGVANALGPNRGFTVRMLRDTAGPVPPEAKIVFTMDNGASVSVPLLSLAEERISQHRPTGELFDSFVNSVMAMQEPRILDIGGRDRSGIDRRLAFKHGADRVTVLDIQQGKNVDVVGDAHELSAYFAPDTFDAVYSASVFEHILMPWKVALEMNKVMRMGGIGLVMSHQTCGMHDFPWDFWRFSDSAWDALFNKHTGFEILARAVEGKQFVVPFFCWPPKEEVDRSFGYEISAVLIRKVSAPSLAWPVKLAEVISTTYPVDREGTV